MKREFETIQDECNYLSAKAFNTVGLVEVAGISGVSFEVIRGKLLDLANDIKRIGEKVNDNGS